ncbi:g7352 [Coccomyxa viridis]|uniref:G7352 protein n=1 Tax=Coccomyxa viridis TaxID=1274662 RepID=A0ABP1FXM4_9CHLO
MSHCLHLKGPQNSTRHVENTQFHRRPLHFRYRAHKQLLFVAFTHDGQPEAETRQQSAALAAQRILEWPRLCSHVAAFASTTLGRKAVLELQVPPTHAETERLLAETRAMDVLEAELAADLDFGGISTSQAADGVKRAQRGGMLTGAMLTAVASLLTGATRLQRGIISAAASSQEGGQITENSPIWPIYAPIKSLPAHQRIVADITAAIGEDMLVRDSASEEVRRTRNRCRTIEGRLRSILKGVSGEVSEQSGRLCVAVPSSEAQPKGIVLGGSSSAGVLYIEPQAAVPLNNDLAAARGEAYAAVENVLWKLTGLIADTIEDVQQALDTVLWLDTTAAKARYGRWIDGCLPSFAPFPTTTKARTKQQKKDAAVEAAARAASGMDDDSFIRLSRLRHPLLHADYLTWKDASLRREQRPKSAAGPARRLATRKDVMAQNSGAASDVDSDAEGSESESDERESKRPPVPINICVRPELRSVIITGPNTGGKTATLKAFGLAVLMAKAGLPVPATTPAQLPPFSAVLADIGDEQSLFANLSTFSGHLKRIQALRREADGKALVLLDEVGTGTDPAEGAALGIALLRALVAGGPRGAAFTMATTHHSSLTSLKYQDERFENASVEFDEAKLAPTYRLMWGIPGRSNALNIASRLGMDTDIIQAARARMGSAQGEVDDAIAELEGMRRAAEADEATTVQMRKRLVGLQGTLRKSRAKVAEVDAKQAQRMAEAINRAADRAEAQLNSQARKDKAASKQRQQEHEAAKAEQQRQKKEKEALEAQKRDQWVPKVGSMIFIPRMKGNFKVVSVKGDQVSVQLGALKINVALDEIRRQ